MDRSMNLWTHDAASGLWMNACSVGDAGAQCLGYFGGIFGPDGDRIMAHGFTGELALRMVCLSHVLRFTVSVTK